MQSAVETKVLKLIGYLLAPAIETVPKSVIESDLKVPKEGKLINISEEERREAELIPTSCSLLQFNKSDEMQTDPRCCCHQVSNIPVSFFWDSLN